MLQATISQFKQHAKAYFDLIEKGEKIRITRYGRVIAEVGSVESIDQLLSWKQPGLKLVVKGVSITKMILQERDGATR